MAKAPRLHGHRAAAPVAAGVVEQVRERALELAGVGLDERQVGLDLARGPRARPGAATRSADSITSSIEHQSSRGRSAGLELGEVEQVVDEPGQARGLRADDRRQLLGAGARRAPPRP